MEAPSKAFLLFYLLPDWLKLNNLISRTECGFSDIFSRHICFTVAETIGVTNYAEKLARKMFRKPHLKLLRLCSVRGTNKTALCLLIQYSPSNSAQAAHTLGLKYQFDNTVIHELPYSLLPSSQRTINSNNEILYCYQEFLCPVEPLYFSDEKSITVEK